MVKELIECRNTPLPSVVRRSNAALNHLRDSGHVVDPDDEKRLSPLASKHCHVQGRYHFALTGDAVRRGELRPLRDANSFEPEALIA